MTDAIESSEPQAGISDRVPELDVEMVDHAVDAIAKAAPSLTRADARRLGAVVVGRICSEIGGTRLYLPKGDAIERTLRDQRIYSEFDGTTDGPNGIRALARRHSMTDANIWRIIKRERTQRKRPKEATA